MRRDGLLTFRDRFCWHGPWDQETATWHFGTAPACGTLFITGPMPETQTESLAPQHISHAALGTTHGGTVLRCTGPAESVTRWIVDTALQIAGHRAHHKPWLLGTHAVGPNHWFSSLGHGAIDLHR